MPVRAWYTPNGGGKSCPPLFTIFLCKFDIFKTFVRVVIKADVDSALGPVAPTGKFFLGQIHTWGSFCNLFDINPDHFQNLTLHEHLSAKFSEI